MANPYASQCKSSGAMKARAVGGGVKSDAAQDKGLIRKAMGAHDKQQHGGSKTDLSVVGLKRGGRLDRPRRDKGGLHKKFATNVSAAVPPEDLVSPAPTGLPPPGMSSGPMPNTGLMQNRGGSVKKASGGAISSLSEPKFPKKMTAGADSGPGRLEKAH